MKIKELKEWLNQYKDDDIVLNGVSEDNKTKEGIFYVGDLIDYIIAEEGYARYKENGSQGKSLKEIKELLKI